MAIRDGFLHVRVVDPAGAPLPVGPNLKVSAGIAPVPFDPADGFKLKLTSSELELTIEQGTTVLHQWFDVKAPADPPELNPFWPGTDGNPNAAGKRIGYLLECMRIIRTAGGTATDKSPKVFMITVTIHPAREYVAVIGTDYWEDPLGRHGSPHQANLDLRGPSRTYAKHLSLTGRLKPSDRFVALDCERGHAELLMQAQNFGFRAQQVFMEKEAPPNWLHNLRAYRDWYLRVESGREPASKYLGATDIYKYVSDVGLYRPGTVIDFSIFSHAWKGGPILFNTDFDRNNPIRDPTDLDMRSSQDFVAPNVSEWPNLRAAFAPGAIVNIWGCFAEPQFFEMLKFLVANKPGAFFEFWDDDDVMHFLDHNGVLDELRKAMQRSLMQQIASHIACHAYGGPPGLGSDIHEYSDKGEKKYLPLLSQSLKNVISGPIMRCELADAMSSPIGKLLRTPELGSRVFDAFGYMRYVPAP